MSTKTLRKRIALVAVSALGAGLLSVAPASAAITGIAVAAANTQPGVCVVTDSTTDTATAIVGGTVVLNSTSGTSTDDSYVSITGPGSFVQLDTDVTYTTGGQALLPSTSDTIGIKATAVGTIKVTFRNTETGSAAYVFVITVVSSCSNGTPSTEYSYVRTVVSGSGHAYGTYSMDSSVDEADTGTIAYGATGYIRAKLKDAYNATLPSTGVLEVKATGDVTIGVEAAASADPSAGSASTWISTGTGADLSIAVAQNSGAATTSTVTISYNGVVVSTKSFTFLGKVAKVELVDQSVGVTSGNGFLQFKLSDSAGNVIGSKNIASDTTYNAAAIAVVSSVSAGSTTTSATTGKTAAVDTTATASTMARFACTAKGGSASLQVKAATDSTNTEYVYSAPFTVYCGGALDTWSISLDKASYAPGEIATLTVSGKDADGHAVNSTVAMTGVEYSFGGLTAVAAPTTTDKFTSGTGIKKYTFSVGTSEGAFVGTYKITGATDTAAKTLQYKVASTSASVTNAEVLAAIVKLIASINKQITALQKLLTKKK